SKVPDPFPYCEENAKSAILQCHIFSHCPETNGEWGSKICLPVTRFRFLFLTVPAKLFYRIRESCLQFHRPALHNRRWHKSHSGCSVSGREFPAKNWYCT